MTREEAIKMLKSKMDGHTDTSYEWAETVRMAINALEQQPCYDYNCISRQAVLNTLDKIRAEIEKESEVQTLQLHWGEAMGLNMAIDIINKYKSESEKQNARM